MVVKFLLMFPAILSKKIIWFGISLRCPLDTDTLLLTASFVTLSQLAKKLRDLSV